MLSLQALESALPLAERFDQRGLLVLPRADTPLEMLVNRTRSPETVTSSHDGVSIKVDLNVLAASAAIKDPVFGDSDHDNIFDQIAEVCIPAVQGHVKFAKEVVAPAIDDLVTRTTDILSQHTPSQLLGMEVRIDELPAPLMNASFDTMVRKFEETPLDSPSLSFNLPDQTGAEIVELMKTGSASLDADIEQFAATLGDGCLIDIWAKAFQQRQADVMDSRTLRFADLLSAPDCGVDNALVIFLLARKLQDNPLDGISMSLSTYETLMADFRDQAAAFLCRELNAYEQAEKAGALVISMTSNEVVVNPRLYKEWIDNGGENEVLFGNLLQSNPYVMLEDIEANAASLKRAWTNHAALTATVESNRRFSRTKEALASVFRRQLRELSDDDASQIDVGAVTARFDELLDDVVESDMECLYTLGLKLVCRSRFSQTEAERILGGIDRVKKKNPSLEIREAATISVIEYVAWWVGTQLQVVDAKLKQTL